MNEIMTGMKSYLIGILIFPLATYSICKEMPSLNAYLENGRLLLEIPASHLGEEMLFVRDRIGFEHVTWERHLDRMFLCVRDVYSSTGTIIPANNERSPYSIPRPSGIVKVFPISENGQNGLMTIDITQLFINNTSGFLSFDLQAIDPDRSYIENVRVYSGRIEIDAVQTVSGLGDPTPKSTNNHWSIVSLPEEPMRARLFDPRMAFFRENGHRLASIYPSDAAILRWRLEKKNSDLSLSVPIKPIVFYLDPNIPKKWIPYVKRGVLEWNKAFEAAGFLNAIQVKDVPPSDPNWSVADMGCSVVRWIDYTNRRQSNEGIRSRNNSTGTVNTVWDMRTGELLKADIVFGPPFGWMRYVIRLAAADSTLTLPVSDEIIGHEIQQLVAHEAGHALGLEDGHYGKFAYPAECLNSIDWLSEYGHTPSIMNYDRENYTLQPGTDVPLEMRFQHVGPADVHQIKWGYVPVPQADDPEAELPFLDEIIREQDSIPWLGFVGGKIDQLGPYRYGVISSDDPVYTTQQGIKNLKTVIKWLPQHAEQNYRDSETLEQLYFLLLEQWVKEMQHVSSLIGGYAVQRKGSSQPGAIYTPVLKVKQKEAMQFLLDNAFNPPLWLAEKGITQRFTKNETLENIANIQSQVLSDLLEIYKFQRMTEMELTMDSSVVYSRREFLDDLKRGVWSELYGSKNNIGGFRQELQHTFLLIFEQLLDKDVKIENQMARLRGASNGLSISSRSLLIQALRELGQLIDDTSNRFQDNAAKGHLFGCRRLIDQILEKR